MQDHRPAALVVLCGELVRVDQSALDQIVDPVLEIRDLEAVVVTATDRLDPVEPIAGAAVVIRLQDKGASLIEQNDRSAVALAPAIPIRSGRPTVDAQDQRVPPPCFVADRIVEDAFDLLVARAVPMNDFDLRLQLRFEARIQMGQSSVIADSRPAEAGTV